MSYQILLVTRLKSLKPLLLGLGVIFVSSVLLIAAMLLAVQAVAFRRGIDISFNSFTLLSPLIIFLITCLLFIGNYFMDRSRKLYWIADPQRESIEISEIILNRPRTMHRFRRDEISALQLHWQPSYLGKPSRVGGPGWWMADLLLQNGEKVHLHGIQAARIFPPPKWMRPFEQAAQVSGLDLRIERAEN